MLQKPHSYGYYWITLKHGQHVPAKYDTSGIHIIGRQGAIPDHQIESIDEPLIKNPLNAPKQKATSNEYA